METFIYESQSPTSHFGGTMSGHFTFEYLDGPNKGEEFDMKIDEFQFNLPDGF